MAAYLARWGVIGAVVGFTLGCAWIDWQTRDEKKRPMPPMDLKVMTIEVGSKEWLLLHAKECGCTIL